MKTGTYDWGTTDIRIVRSRLVARCRPLRLGTYQHLCEHAEDTPLFITWFSQTKLSQLPVELSGSIITVSPNECTSWNSPYCDRVDRRALFFTPWKELVAKQVSPLSILQKEAWRLTCDPQLLEVKRQHVSVCYLDSWHSSHLHLISFSPDKLFTLEECNGTPVCLCMCSYFLLD